MLISFPFYMYFSGWFNECGTVRNKTNEQNQKYYKQEDKKQLRKKNGPQIFRVFCDFSFRQAIVTIFMK